MEYSSVLASAVGKPRFASLRANNVLCPLPLDKLRSWLRDNWLPAVWLCLFTALLYGWAYDELARRWPHFPISGMAVGVSYLVLTLLELKFIRRVLDASWLLFWVPLDLCLVVQH